LQIKCVFEVGACRVREEASAPFRYLQSGGRITRILICADRHEIQIAIVGLNLQCASGNGGGFTEVQSLRILDGHDLHQLHVLRLNLKCGAPLPKGVVAFTELHKNCPEKVLSVEISRVSTRGALEPSLSFGKMIL